MLKFFTTQLTQPAGQRTQPGQAKSEQKERNYFYKIYKGELKEIHL